MAASVRIEDEAFSDERYEDLASIAGLADADHARGKMARLWRQCTLEQTHVLPIATVVRVLGPRAVDALHVARLGEQVDETTIRIRGTEGRIEWLQKLRDNGKFGKKGGRPRKTQKPTRVTENAKLETPPAPAPAPAPAQEREEALSLDPVPQTSQLPKSASTPVARSPRQIERTRLFDRAWNFGLQEHLRLKQAGIDPHARPWSATPHGEEKDRLFARIDDLTEGDAPDWDRAWEVIQNRVLVAVAEAKRADIRHLRYFTPARIWDRESFSIGGALSPQQAAVPRNGAQPAPSSMRIKASDDDMPPIGLGGKR